TARGRGLPPLPLQPQDAAPTGGRIAAALHGTPRQDVIHLGVKPSNVMMRDCCEAVLIDFGFSHHLRLPDLLAEEFPGPMGTGAYIAPEQLLGERSDPRSDIFALGVLMYFFVTGERPFGEPETLRGWRRRLYGDPVPPRARRPDCPPWLQEVILRCLEVDPARRHPTAAQLAFDLQHPGQIAITARGERTQRPGLVAAAAARPWGGRRRGACRRGASGWCGRGRGRASCMTRRSSGRPSPLRGGRSIWPRRCALPCGASCRPIRTPASSA